MKLYKRILGLLLAVGLTPILTVNAAYDSSGEVANRKAIAVESNAIQNWPAGPVVDAESAIVMEASTGAVLYEKNIHEQLYPASITKIMTVLVALENSNLSDMVTFSHDAVFNIEGGSSIIGGVNEGDQMTLEQCLYGIMLCSGNEAAYAVAEHVGGTVDNFVQMMNDKAKELGCQDTHFSNPHGLPVDDHVVSAYDMALISKAALAIDEFRTITSTVRYTFPPTSSGEERIRVNHHKMLAGQAHAYDGCIGGKTGYTTVAGQTLVTFAERNGMTLICVVLKEVSPSQFTDTKTLLDYGFDNFKLLNVADNETRFTIDNANFFKTNVNVFNNSENLLTLNKEGNVVIPNTLSFENLEPSLNFNTTDDVVAALSYTYQGKYLGGTNIELTSKTINSFDFDDSVVSQEASTNDKSDKADNKFTFINIKAVLIILLIIAILLGIIFGIRLILRNYYFVKSRRRKIRRKKRRDLDIDDYKL